MSPETRLAIGAALALVLLVLVFYGSSSGRSGSRRAGRRRLPSGPREVRYGG